MSKNITDLPPEITYIILDHVGVQHMPNISMVCKRWSEYVEYKKQSVRHTEDFYEACEKGDVLSVRHFILHTKYSMTHVMLCKGVKLSFKSGNIPMIKYILGVWGNPLSFKFYKYAAQATNNNAVEFLNTQLSFIPYSDRQFWVHIGYAKNKRCNEETLNILRRNFKSEMCSCDILVLVENIFRAGYIPGIEFVLKYTVDENVLEKIITGTCMSGNVSLLEDVFKKYDNMIEPLKKKWSVVVAAMKSQSIDILLLVFSGDVVKLCTTKYILTRIIQKGYTSLLRDVANLTINVNGKSRKPFYDEGMNYSLCIKCCDNIETVKECLRLRINVDLNECLTYSCQCKLSKLSEYLINIGATVCKNINHYHSSVNRGNLEWMYNDS